MDEKWRGLGREYMPSNQRDPVPYNPSPYALSIRCTATRRNGERCRKPSVITTRHLPRPVCLTHLRGRARAVHVARLDPDRRVIMHEAARYGRYSLHIPTDLLANYERALRDPDLIAMRDELALLDSRMQAMLAALEQGSTNALWDSLSALATRATTAAEAATLVTDVNPATRESKALATRTLVDCAYALAKLCAAASSAASTWSEMYDLLELRRRLSETEQKRLVALNTVLSSDKALALVAALAGSIRKHVSDSAALLAISADFSVILNASVSPKSATRTANAAAIPAALDPTIPQSDIDAFDAAIDIWDPDSADPLPTPPPTRRVRAADRDTVPIPLPSPLSPLRGTPSPRSRQARALANTSAQDGD